MWEGQFLREQVRLELVVDGWGPLHWLPPEVVDTRGTLALVMESSSGRYSKGDSAFPFLFYDLSLSLILTEAAPPSVTALAIEP